MTRVEAIRLVTATLDKDALGQPTFRGEIVSPDFPSPITAYGDTVEAAMKATVRKAIKIGPAGPPAGR